ncbi:uncharacterized protein si:ch211-113e8.11 [Amphiprion ocellaris]|uniref:uncharacterized protein si:ch211-113e8.11 n=1 Tax=Amphiprion ocellaris TaxID=80972 RepID=UPI000C318CD8|nr:uncharacterized protein si:ch211-113e8.11 [Amphiprion ocellaris]
MNSLVGYGVSSDSDSDGDVEDGSTSAAGSTEQVGDEAAAVRKTRNFLLESDSASSESVGESEPEDEDPEPSSSSPAAHLQASASSPARQPSLPSPPQSYSTSNKLPSPPLNACSDSSVFANPFKAQADQKLSALQKHVPLTMQAKPSQIGGKRMCVSYRKDGRCRFGIKCKFAHDSDLQTPVIPSDCHLPESEETPAEAVGSSCGGGSQNNQKEMKEEESEGQQVKKRRVGLSNTLIPPKRAMKQYAMQRDREHINMS